MPEAVFSIPEPLEQLLNFSERVFWAVFDANGLMCDCSQSFNRILGEFDEIRGRKIEEIFLHSYPTEMRLHLKDLGAADNAGPVLLRLAMSGRPCRVLACLYGAGVFCWGEVIGDSSSTGLNELSRLSGKIQELLGNIRQQKEELEKDLRAAGWLQRRLLPQESKFPGWRLAWKFRPYDCAGGDLFGVFSLPDKRIVSFLIDVAGHGITSAMMGVAVAQNLHEFGVNSALRAADPSKFPILLQRLEEEFPIERFNLYFTMIYLEYCPDTRTVAFVNAGHPAPILHKAGSLPCEIKEAGPFVGLDQSNLIPVNEFQVSPGDRFYMYSDGITERRNQAGDFFAKGLILDFLEHNCDCELGDLVEKLLLENDSFAAAKKADDDITFIGLEFCG